MAAIQVLLDSQPGPLPLKGQFQPQGDLAPALFLTGTAQTSSPNNTIQVPVGLAANICGISAAVLAQFIHTGAAHCDAQGNGTATG